MTSTSPSLKVSQISSLATEQSFQKGQRYVRDGAIATPVRQGNTLWADCYGSEIYHPRATLGPQGVEDSSCTCPYDWGGICKHQVALLLTYLQTPNRFQVLQPLQKLLAQRSRDDLLQMIEQMVQRHPDLISVVDAPPAPTPGQMPDLTIYRRQIKRVFQSDEMEAMAKGLAALSIHGDRLLEQGDWFQAGTLYQLLLEAANAHYDYNVLDIDYDGEVGCEIQAIAEGLSTCLAQAKDLTVGERRLWVETLFDAVVKDIELGGMDYAYPAGKAIAHHTQDEDWAWLEPRIREEITKAQSRSFSNWGQSQLVNLLSAGASRHRGKQTADDVILELGTPEQQAFFHLEKRNLEEAIAIAETHFKSLPGLVTQFADGLLEAKAPDLALKFVQNCCANGRHYSYQDWLTHFYQHYGTTEQFLEAQLELLKTRFTLPGYQTLQAKAEPLGDWPSLRQVLHQALISKKAYDSLIEIALWEQDWQSAQDYLQKLSPGIRTSLQERVAKAIKTDEPAAAISLYRALSERAINQRGRENYQRAVRYLKAIAPLYKQLKQEEDFQQYVQTLRTQHSNLRAFHDELHKAEL